MQIESKENLKFKNNLYKIVLVSFVTISVWIVLEINWSYRKVPATGTIETQINPLNPNLDTKTIDLLETRYQIPNRELISFQQELVTYLALQAQESEIDSVPKSTPPATDSASLELSLPPLASPSALPNLP